MLINKRDRISLYLHIYICKELKKNPSKINIIIKKYNFLKKQNHISNGFKLWEEVLNQNSFKEMFKLILQKNQTGQLLRSSSICSGILEDNLVKKIKFKFKGLYEI